MILTRKLALSVAGVAAAGVLGTAGVAAATSDNSTPTPTPTAATAPSSSGAPAADHARAKWAKRAFFARGMHGEWVVKGKDGKPTTLETIRGQVTAVGPTSITIKAEDGFTETFVVNSDTKVKGADVSSISAVKVGAKGAAVGVKVANTITARAVHVRK
jgi:hypothetical protein